MMIMVFGILIFLYLIILLFWIYEFLVVIQVDMFVVISQGSDLLFLVLCRVQLIEQWLIVWLNILDVIEWLKLFVDSFGMSEIDKIGVLCSLIWIESIQVSGVFVDFSMLLVVIVISVCVEIVEIVVVIVNDFVNSVVNCDRENCVVCIVEMCDYLMSEENWLGELLVEQDRMMVDFIVCYEDVLFVVQEYL